MMREMLGVTGVCDAHLKWSDRSKALTTDLSTRHDNCGRCRGDFSPAQPDTSTFAITSRPSRDRGLIDIAACNRSELFHDLCRTAVWRYQQEHCFSFCGQVSKEEVAKSIECSFRVTYRRWKSITRFTDQP